MSNQEAPPIVTVTAVAGGLAFVRGRIVPGGAGRRWEYLGSHTSREEALAVARAQGATVHEDDGMDKTASADGIAPTRPPADS